MPSAPDGPSTPPFLPAVARGAPTPAAPCAAAQLAQASSALWVATLSLMTAFMQTPAPAHRYLLARRIARNFETLAAQDCFDSGSRASFGRLSGRWQAKSEQFAPERQAGARSRGLLRFLS